MFNELKKKVLGDFDVKLNISMKNETISVSFVPTLKTASSVKQLKPIIISGSADDLDANFLQIISQTFTEKSQMIYDVQAFSKSLESVKTETEEKAKKLAEKPAKSNLKAKAKTESVPEPVIEPVEELAEPVQIPTEPVEESNFEAFDDVDDLLGGLDI